jgi:hypothetical protein
MANKPALEINLRIVQKRQSREIPDDIKPLLTSGTNRINVALNEK